MKVRKIPMRSCVVTKERLPKSELLRIVRCPDGIIRVDKTGKMNGRGAYIKKDIEVLKQAKKNNILKRVLGVDILNEVYEEISKIISN